MHFKLIDNLFLGVGTTESIVIPQEHVNKNLTQQVLDLQSFMNEKKRIGVKCEFDFHYCFQVDNFL